MKTVLAVAVHPDDETLGCGGTLLAHARQGDRLFWLIFTEAGAHLGYGPQLLERRERQIGQVARAYGFEGIFRLGFAASRLHEVPFETMLAAFQKVVADVAPEIVYSVNRSDVHTDHQTAARVVASGTKAFRAQCIKRVLLYECLSETEAAPQHLENLFVPQVYSDISATLEGKLDILDCYATELQAPPQPRNRETVTALARVRGAAVCLDYAEAFMIQRFVL